jgi:hypothetical protein
MGAMDQDGLSRTGDTFLRQGWRSSVSKLASGDYWEPGAWLSSPALTPPTIVRVSIRG